MVLFENQSPCQVLVSTCELSCRTPSSETFRLTVNRTSQTYYLLWDTDSRRLFPSLLTLYISISLLVHGVTITSSKPWLYLIISFHILSILDTSLEKKQLCENAYDLDQKLEHHIYNIIRFLIYILITICTMIYLHEGVNNWPSLLSWWTERKLYS